MSVMTPRRFGRIHAPDPRDASYPMRALLPAVPSTRTQRYWSATGWWGDQKDTPECVAYAWLHWLEDGPVPQRSAPPPIILPDVLYHDAQDRDEFPGTNYDGTSVRGAVKALVARGFVKNYHWAQTLEDIVQALLEVGPVGAALVTLRADADLGEGVQEIIGTMDFVVIAGRAVALELEAGPPTEQAPPAATRRR